MNIFDSIYDESGNVKWPQPFAPQMQQAPIQQMQQLPQNPIQPAPAPQYAMPQGQVDLSQYMFNQKQDPNKAVADMGLLNRAQLQANLNNNLTARDDERKKYLAGQALGAILGLGMGVASGNSAQQNIGNMIPALQGTHAMLQNSTAQDQADKGIYTSGLEQYYKALTDVNKENLAIDKGNQTAAVSLAKIQPHPTEPWKDTKIGDWIRKDGVQMFTMLGKDNVPYHIEADKVQQKPSEASTGIAVADHKYYLDRYGDLQDQHKKNDAAIGELRMQLDKDGKPVITDEMRKLAAMSGKVLGDPNEAISVFEKINAQVEDEMNKAGKFLGYDQSQMHYMKKADMKIPGQSGKGHSGKVAPGAMF